MRRFWPSGVSIRARVLWRRPRRRRQWRILGRLTLPRLYTLAARLPCPVRPCPPASQVRLPRRRPLLGRCAPRGRVRWMMCRGRGRHLAMQGRRSMGVIRDRLGRRGERAGDIGRRGGCGRELKGLPFECAGGELYIPADGRCHLSLIFFQSLCFVVGPSPP